MEGEQSSQQLVHDWADVMRRAGVYNLPACINAALAAFHDTRAPGGVSYLLLWKFGGFKNLMTPKTIKGKWRRFLVGVDERLIADAEAKNMET